MNNRFVDDTQSLASDFRYYYALIKHWAWLFILAAVLSGGIAYFVSRNMTPVYQASATMLVNQAPSTSSSEYVSILTSQRLVQTYAQMIIKQPVLEGVIETLNLELTPAQLKKMVFVNPIEDTQLIEIKVQHPNPDVAADIANTIVVVFSKQNEEYQTSRYKDLKKNLSNQLEELGQAIERDSIALQSLGDSREDEAERNRLETSLAQNRQLYATILKTFEDVKLAEAESTSNVMFAETAIPPIHPIKPKVMQNTLLAGIVGLFLAVGVILLVEALDDTIKGPMDVEKNLRLPILGVILQMPDNEALITAKEPRSPISEAFRSLRTNIQFTSVDFHLKTLLVTSATPQDGKTTVISNLAVVLAQGGKKVTLVDSDLRKPKVHKMFGLSNSKGLTSLFVQSEMRIDNVLQHVTKGLSVITSGSLPPNPAELLGSEKMNLILSKMKEKCDVVLLDTPPVFAVTDAAVLSRYADGVLVVVKPGYTKITVAKQSIEQLKRVGANILGVVLNDVKVRGSKYSAYYYSNGYYYYHDYYGTSKKSKKGKKKVSKKSSRTTIQ